MVSSVRLCCCTLISACVLKQSSFSVVTNVCCFTPSRKMATVVTKISVEIEESSCDVSDLFTCEICSV